MTNLCIRRENRVGMKFLISADMRDNTCIISKGKDKITVKANIHDISQAWWNWEHGMLAQQAFHFMSPDERDFLITGLTPEQWNLMFGDE